MDVIHDVVVIIKVCHVVLMMCGCGNVFGVKKIRKNTKKNKKKYRSGSISVHKRSHCLYVPEYGSASQTLVKYACICTSVACVNVS